jgi:tRNA-specific 2-thiouridylase
LKFDRFLTRAQQLGFDAIATGHHARVTRDNGRWALRRGHDAAKDQSYVLHMLDQRALSQVLLPVGDMNKADVRAIADARGLRTAAKPDSQDTCFLPSAGGRATFLGDRIPLRPGRVVDAAGNDVGIVDAIELVTVGQRRGLGVGAASADGEARYAVAVDTLAGVVTVGGPDDLLCGGQSVTAMTWTDAPVPVDADVFVQTSAHGATAAATWIGEGVRWREPHRLIAPGQSVVLYAPDNDVVLGGGIAS